MPGPGDLGIGIACRVTAGLSVCAEGDRGSRWSGLIGLFERTRGSAGARGLGPPPIRAGIRPSTAYVIPKTTQNGRQICRKTPNNLRTTMRADINCGRA